MNCHALTKHIEKATMKSKLSKFAKLALGLIAATMLPSCLQNETTITLNKDGSGTIVEETILGAQMIAMMTQFAEPGQPDPLAEMFSEEKSKKRAAAFGEGVEFVKIEMINADGKKGARSHFKFADINKITVNPSSAMESLNEEGAEEEEEEKPADDKEALKFAYADGKLKIIVPPADFKDMAMEDMGEGGEQEEMAMQMMADMRIGIKLVIADGIAESNATHVEGNSITLFDVQVGKMMAQKDKLKEIAKTAETDMDAAKAAFNKIDGIKVETKEDVNVTLK